MARPKLKIDETLVEKLATIQCSTKEIAAIVGCSPDTIEGRFSEILAKGREKGKMSLRRAMFEKALGGNATMMIWLSKQYLGMTDKVENKVETGKDEKRLVIQFAGGADAIEIGKKPESN